MFGNPSDPSERLIYVQRGGDWTEKVHDILQRDTVRPAWVAGPFASPYSNANNYDNQILVASGIGITPALDVMRAQKAKRRVNLIWACRDRHLIMFFVRHVAFDQDGWNLIFYSGKDELPEEDKEFLSKVNVCLVKGRPKLSKVIPNIVHGIESGRGLPEQYYEANGKSEMNHTARTVSSSKPTHFNDDLMDVEKIQQELKEKEDEIVRLRKLLNVHLGNLNSLDTMQDSKAQFEEVDDDGSVEDTEIPLSPSDRPKQGSNLKNAEKRNPSRNVSLKSFRSASSVDELKQSINKQRTELEQKLKKMKTSFRSKDNDSANDGFSIGNSDFEPLSDDIIEEGGTGADILIPWEHDEGPKYVTNLCSEKVLSTWGLLYCGGSNKIKDHLKQVSEHYDIDLYVECFDW